MVIWYITKLRFDLYINSLRARPPVSISSELSPCKPFLGRPCLFPAILITIGRLLAGDWGQNTTVLPPIVRHFDVVPGSLVCDVMLRRSQRQVNDVIKQLART
jgi:hypothetical protein